MTLPFQLASTEMIMTHQVSRTRDERTAVDKAISVLKAFDTESNTGIGVSELARRTDLSKSTAFRILTMLERNQVVERAGSAYRLGPVIRELGGQNVTPAQGRLREIFTPFLAELYAETRMTAQLAVLSGTQVVYLNKLEGVRRLRTPSRISGRMPAYCTGVGKVLLAYDPEALEQTLAEPRHAWTPTTLVDAEALQAELSRVRERGVAIDRGESLETLCCVAAPIMGSDGRPVAAISLSGDTATFHPSKYESILRRVCYTASRTLAHSRVTLVAA
jgi:IclR family KDG regulon transcriptional repressor